MLPIVTMTEAKARGLKVYFTGKPCPKGHVSARYVAINRAKSARFEVI